jgi:hypothetical protein
MEKYNDTCIMSYYLIDFGSSKVDFNFDNLIIGRKIKSDTDNSKYYIYYQNEPNETPKEIFIRLPKLRLIYNLANQKFNQLNIPIYPNWEQTNNFIKFIQKLELDINDCFSNKKINKEWVSIINKKNTLNFIKTSIYENYKITSDIENKNVSFDDFKLNGQIDVVIKLSYIWCKNNKIGLSSQLYQLKYFAPPDQLDINFIDPEEPKKSITIPSGVYKTLLDPQSKAGAYLNNVPLLPPYPFNNPFNNQFNNQLKNNEEIKHINPEELALKSFKLSGNTAISLPPQIALNMNLVPNIKDLQKAIKGLKPVINKD